MSGTNSKQSWCHGAHDGAGLVSGWWKSVAKRPAKGAFTAFLQKRVSGICACVAGPVHPSVRLATKRVHQSVCEAVLTPASRFKSFVAMLRLSERASGAVYASRLHRRLFSSNLSLIKTVRAAGQAGWRGAGCTDSLPPAP